MNTIAIACYTAILLIGGYWLPLLHSRGVARILAWTTAIATVWLSYGFTIDATAPVRTTVMVFMQLLSMKVLVLVESYSESRSLSFLHWLAFALGWFGMNPRLFERLPGTSYSFWPILNKGFSRILVGVLLLYASSKTSQHSATDGFFIPELLLLMGISLILHFGIVNISTAAWRRCGVEAPELFRAPYRARTLKEFWGRRWNVAFSEMTASIAYRPLKHKVGEKPAMVVSFLLSGALHEIAISLPVRSSYGLPMLYFIIHAVAMRVESWPWVSVRLNQSLMLSRVWVFVLLMSTPSIVVSS